VLELCRDAAGLQRLAYVSTAYVAGRRRGVVYEHELVMGQDFKNHYESTKFQAEVWVREAMDAVPTTILRPAIVVGDSRTGETAKFDGPYYLLRSIAQLRRYGLPPVQVGRSAATFNVVPVDYVVEAILEAASLPAARSETLHLVDPQPVTTRELVTTLAHHLTGAAPRGSVSPRVAGEFLRSKAIRRAFGGTPRESIAYLNHPVTFDSRRTVDLLGPRGLTPPRFADYAEAMVRFFSEHQDDPSLASARGV
jgi:thioester reductase-like protein